MNTQLNAREVIREIIKNKSDLGIKLHKGMVRTGRPDEMANSSVE